MDAELKRYNMRVNLYDSVEDSEELDGQWVRFEDAKKIIEELEEELEESLERANSDPNDSGTDGSLYD